MQPPMELAAGGRLGLQPTPAKPPSAPVLPFAKLRLFTNSGREQGGFRNPLCRGLRLYFFFPRRESRLPRLNPDPFRSDLFEKCRSLPLPTSPRDRGESRGAGPRSKKRFGARGLSGGGKTGPALHPAVNPRRKQRRQGEGPARRPLPRMPPASKSRGSRPGSLLLRSSAVPGAERPGQRDRSPRPPVRLV